MPIDVLCKILHCRFYPVSPFPRNGQNMALYGQNMILTWSLKSFLPESLSIFPGIFHAKFHVAGYILQSPFLEWTTYGPFMTKTWSSHDPSNWFLLNFNQCVKGYSMLNFTLQGVSFSPFQKTAKIWPFYGQNIFLT